jgi:hypothetical protein
LDFYFIHFFNMSFDSSSNPDIISMMIDFENGDLSQRQTIDFFQQLIDSGTVWHLQGSYGRMVSELIRTGYCKPSEDSHQDAYGNVIPSREAFSDDLPTHQTTEA